LDILEEGKTALSHLSYEHRPLLVTWTILNLHHVAQVERGDALVMSSGESYSEPRPTWREKLSHSIFGSHTSASDAAAASAPKPHTSHASTSEESLTSNDSCRTSFSAAAAAAAAAAVASPQPISPHSPPLVMPSASAGKDQKAVTKTVVASPTSSSPSYNTSLSTSSAEEKSKDSDKSSSSSRRKQLSTIFAAWRPASSNNAERVAGRSGARLNRADSSSASNGVESEPLKSSSIGQSITHGVKSWQERHRLNREAVETFKTMKTEEGSASSESVEEAYSPDKTSIGQTSTNFDATNIPEEMLRGEMMLKVTPKKVKQRMFRLDSDRGQIFWESILPSLNVHIAFTRSTLDLHHLSNGRCIQGNSLDCPLRRSISTMEGDTVGSANGTQDALVWN